VLLPDATPGSNGRDESNAFAMIMLNEPTAAVDYYPMPSLGTARNLR
jgi:hypothetical protein